MKRREPSLVATAAAIVLTVSFILIAFVATPLLALLLGMAIGYILEIFTGDYVVKAFHALGLTRVHDGDLPMVFGLLAILATFIRVNISGRMTKEGDK